MIRNFNVPIYDADVAMATTHEELNKLLLEYDCDTTDIYLDGYCAQGASCESQFILGCTHQSPAVLCHECIHLAKFILDRAQIDVKDSNCETLAYLVGFLVDKCLSYSKVPPRIRWK